VSSTGIVLLSVFLPIAAIVLLALVIAGGIVAFVLYRRWKRRKAEQRRALGEALQRERERLLEQIKALTPGDEAGKAALPQDAAEQLSHLNLKLEANRQAIFDYEAQSYFPVPSQFRKKGYVYANSKRSAFASSGWA
jgi:type II secretory pathway pseudopilin PulG